MLIVAIDAARITGWAIGSVGSTPASGSWELRSKTQDFHIEGGELIRHLLALFKIHGKPDLIAIEAYMSPAAQTNQTTIISQLLAHGAVYAFARISGIDMVRVDVRTARSVVCGVTPAHIREIANADKRRLAIKEWIRDRLVLLGKLPRGCVDLDQSDSVCVWAWAEAVRALPSLLAS